ncbi:MAG TPA: hypothetical protein PKE39_10890 [Ignavibacteria bacterium]|nr:hypothetical protein [Ignavibacteria bacterium]HMQ99520.1 hypothetical protein [Ignavibacteria bacterium]
MKRSTFLLVITLFCFGYAVNSQTINQKLITGITAVNGQVDAYSLKYDAPTGGWAYAAYDTTTTKFTIITPRGSSKPFNYAMTYNAVFDHEGNSYMIGSENISDTVYRYSVLKNNEIIAEYDYVADGWVIRDNVLYYAAKEGDKNYMVQYNTKTGELTKSKAYDDIRLAYTPDGYSEGEPVGYVGFTKSGSVYYIATLANETFLVIGDTEQKHYSDITWYDLKFNQQGEPCYIAKSQGRFYEERGNTFVVRGDKEYKQFDWIYGPIDFDSDGNPMYVGQDSAGDYKYRSTLMRGGDAINTVEGSIYNYAFTPQGKLYYIISSEKPGKDGSTVWSSSLVIDGKKGKEYSSITSPVFGPKGELMFAASDKNNKYFVVYNNEVISGLYDYISEARFMPNGKIVYIGVKYGNYDKNIPDKSYVIIDDEEFGPYNTVNTADWKSNSIILTEGKSGYAYMAGELVDKKNYTYLYKVYTNKGESKEFDNIIDLKYVNGKLTYFAGSMKDKGSYIYEYSLYVNDKKLGDTYTGYTDAVVKDGVLSFIASKGNDLYYVEARP